MHTRKGVMINVMDKSWIKDVLSTTVTGLQALP